MGYLIESHFWMSIQTLTEGLSSELAGGVAVPGLYVCQDISRLKQEQVGITVLLIIIIFKKLSLIANC